MIVAILTTKISIFLGTSPLPLPPVPPKIGLWAVLHEIRSEYAQILTSIFLLINGPGKWSLDALLSGKRSTASATLETQALTGQPAAALYREKALAKIHCSGSGAD
jgi:hypothetical protein